MSKSYMPKNYLMFNHTCKNESEYHILLGNGKDLISTHESFAEARKALDEISVPDSEWGVINIVAPGEGVTVKDIMKTIPEIDNTTDWDILTHKN